VFPGMLTVEIKERVPAAIWARGNKRYLIDSTGRTLGPVLSVEEWTLPHLAGEGANVNAPLLLMAISRHKSIESQLGYAERIAERRWTVVLKNGSRIDLGADREVEGLDQVATSQTLRRALDEHPAIVDVRTAGRAVMRPVTAGAAVTGVLPRSSMVQTP
jgi:cell division protein FtsQ